MGGVVMTPPDEASTDAVIARIRMQSRNVSLCPCAVLLTRGEQAARLHKAVPAKQKKPVGRRLNVNTKEIVSTLGKLQRAERAAAARVLDAADAEEGAATLYAFSDGETESDGAMSM